MAWKDLLLAGGIVLGALYILYRSLWKDAGRCCGCSGCSAKRKDGSEAC